MRKIDAKTGLLAARRSVLFTVATLEASRRHERQAVALAVQLKGWSPVAEARRDAEDALTRAHAAVAWADYQLDRDVKGFGNELLRDAGGKRENRVFRAFFPEAPSEVVRLGLETEITRCERFALVATKHTLSERAAAALGAVQASMEAGRAALATRRAAFMRRAETSLDAVQWKEATQAARHSVHLQLQTWALEHNEDRAYADRFFMDPRASRTKGKVGPGGSGAEEEEGDEDAV